MHLNADGLKSCPTCNTILNRDFTNPKLRFSKSNYDVSATYDNRLIVSERFKSACEEHCIQGAMFHSLDFRPNHYHMQITPERIIPVCSTKYELNIGERCETCGHRSHFCGANPLFLEYDEPLHQGFYRTDIYFGSKNARHPIELVAMEAKSFLDSMEFHGLDFHPVYSHSTEYLGAGEVGD